MILIKYDAYNMYSCSCTYFMVEGGNVHFVHGTAELPCFFIIKYFQNCYWTLQNYLFQIFLSILFFIYILNTEQKCRIAIIGVIWP